jgi:hypothetical protein
VAEVVSARLGGDLLALLDAARGDASRGAWLTSLITRELARPPRSQPAPAPLPASRAAGSPGAVGVLGPGTASPGVVCFTPGCWQRDTAKYGTRELPLCPACAHAACGLPYSKPQPELPPAWRRRQAEPV